MAFFTAGIPNHAYLGFMLPLTDTDVFDSYQLTLLESPPWTPSASGTFDAFRGIFLAILLGAAFWACIFALARWIWS